VTNIYVLSFYLRGNGAEFPQDFLSYNYKGFIIEKKFATEKDSTGIGREGA
jgi:hypothetical protein